MQEDRLPRATSMEGSTVHTSYAPQIAFLPLASPAMNRNNGYQNFALMESQPPLSYFCDSHRGPSSSFLRSRSASLRENIRRNDDLHLPGSAAIVPPANQDQQCSRFAGDSPSNYYHRMKEKNRLNKQLVIQQYDVDRPPRPPIRPGEGRDASIRFRHQSVPKDLAKSDRVLESRAFDRDKWMHAQSLRTYHFAESMLAPQESERRSRRNPGEPLVTRSVVERKDNLHEMNAIPSNAPPCASHLKRTSSHASTPIPLKPQHSLPVATSQRNSAIKSIQPIEIEFIPRSESASLSRRSCTPANPHGRLSELNVRFKSARKLQRWWRSFPVRMQLSMNAKRSCKLERVNSLSSDYAKKEEIEVESQLISEKHVSPGQSSGDRRKLLVAPRIHDWSKVKARTNSHLEPRFVPRSAKIKIVNRPVDVSNVQSRVAHIWRSEDEAANEKSHTLNSSQSNSVPNIDPLKERHSSIPKNMRELEERTKSQEVHAISSSAEPPEISDHIKMSDLQSSFFEFEGEVAELQNSDFVVTDACLHRNFGSSRIPRLYSTGFLFDMYNKPAFESQVEQLRDLRMTNLSQSGDHHHLTFVNIRTLTEQ